MPPTSFALTVHSLFLLLLDFEPQHLVTSIILQGEGFRKCRTLHKSCPHMTKTARKQTQFFKVTLSSLFVLCVSLPFLQEYLSLIASPALITRICKPFCNQKFKLITSVSEISCNKTRTASRVEITFISCHITDWIYLLQCSRTAGQSVFVGFWLLLFVFSGLLDDNKEKPSALASNQTAEALNK